jgi:hypothetical protein
MPNDEVFSPLPLVCGNAKLNEKFDPQAKGFSFYIRYWIFDIRYSKQRLSCALLYRDTPDRSNLSGFTTRGGGFR